MANQGFSNPVTTRVLENLEKMDYLEVSSFAGFHFWLSETRGGGVAITVKKPWYHNRVFCRDYECTEEMVTEINNFIESVLSELEGLKNVS